MSNRCLESGLYPTNVNSNSHGRFRGSCFAKNGTLNGAYTRELPKALEWAMDVFEGKLEIVECVDPDSVLLLTHMTPNDKPHIMRKNERTDLTGLAINNVNIELSNRVKHFLIDNYGTKYGKLSDLMNQAMKLYYKVEKGFVKLVETDKKPDKSFIMDDKGQISSYDINSLFEVVKEIKTQMNGMDEFIESKIKSTIQSKLNIVPKAKGKIKKAVKGTVRSFQHNNKREKALEILESLMKSNEFGFTSKEFGRNSVRLTGQGDPRTYRSDLDLLEAANLIKKLRSNAHGTMTYQFIENNKYHKYNSELACDKFLEGFKKAFRDIDALSVDELNSFIFERDGLFDAQSQHKRLKWLLTDGCVKRHDVNPRLLFIQK